jgi:hypothetical protein
MAEGLEEQFQSGVPATGLLFFVNNKIDSLEDMNPSSITGQIIAITVHPASEMLRMKTIVLNK